ncbi:MAG: Spy/CpxP family protein refolding chaperone [Gemmatimonadales bacterium]
MRFPILVLATTLLVATPLCAQDSLQDPPRAERLRQLIQERFAARVQEDLGLSDQQAERMRDVAGKYFSNRRNLDLEERRLRRALAAELRPGVAANKDNVGRYTDQLLDLKIRYVQSYKDEIRELGAFLDPVQRAQFLLLREQLLDRVREAQTVPLDTRTVRPRRRALR